MLTSKRIYFLKAWYDWITDNNLTAHIIVDAQYTQVHVPKEYIENSRITLNIAPQAISGLDLDALIKRASMPQLLRFEADFDPPVGVVSIVIPIQAIVAIYADENKQGSFFSSEENQAVATSSEPQSTQERPEFIVVEE